MTNAGFKAGLFIPGCSPIHGSRIEFSSKANVSVHEIPRRRWLFELRDERLGSLHKLGEVTHSYPSHSEAGAPIFSEYRGALPSMGGSEVCFPDRAGKSQQARLFPPPWLGVRCRGEVARYPTPSYSQRAIRQILSTPTPVQETSPRQKPSRK